MSDSYFFKPVFFQFCPRGDTTVHQFFILQEIQKGTGSYKLEWIYHVNEKGFTSEVKRIKNPEVKSPPLNPGEGRWKPGRMFYRDDSLYHVHYIWNDGDGNCCPSAGRVTTTYDIIEDSVNIGRYYFQASHVKRVPYVHPIDSDKYNDY